LIKYIKSVLWRVAKCLSYIEEARCLKVKGQQVFAFLRTVQICNKAYVSSYLFGNVVSFSRERFGCRWPLKVLPLLRMTGDVPPLPIRLHVIHMSNCLFMCTIYMSIMPS